jgi:hypothetical protein
MAELAGKDVVIKISGTATAMVGEATTAAANLTYQITNVVKQVLDRTATIRVHKFSENDAAEDETTTTNIEMAAHGLVTGDLIINETRSNAARIVTYVDDNNVTVAAVTGQTEGDTIAKYPTEAASAYSLNRLNGLVTYASAISRVIKVSGDYLPMSTAAYANDMSRKTECDILEITQFGDSNKKRMPGLLSASGTLTNLDLTDTTYADALTAGDPVVIEDRDYSTSEPNRVWALLEGDELKAAISSAQNEPVSWIAHDEWLKLGA